MCHKLMTLAVKATQRVEKIENSSPCDRTEVQALWRVVKQRCNQTRFKFSIIYKTAALGTKNPKPALEIFIQPRKKVLRSNGKPRLKNLLFSVFVAFSSSRPLVEIKVSLVCVFSSQVNIVVLSPWFHSLQQSCLVKGFLEWNFVGNQKRSRKSFLVTWEESRVSG